MQPMAVLMLLPSAPAAEPAVEAAGVVAAVEGREQGASELEERPYLSYLPLLLCLSLLPLLLFCLLHFLRHQLLLLELPVEGLENWPVEIAILVC